MLCTCAPVCVWPGQGRGLAHFYLLTAVEVAQKCGTYICSKLCTNCVAYFLVLAERLQVRAALSAVSTEQMREQEGRGNG